MDGGEDQYAEPLDLSLSSRVRVDDSGGVGVGAMDAGHPGISETEPIPGTSGSITNPRKRQLFPQDLDAKGLSEDANAPKKMASKLTGTESKPGGKCGNTETKLHQALN